MQLWTPNQSLKNGRFIIKQILGSGGFGVTYSVLEQRTGKLFAIKSLNPIQQSQSDFAEKQEKFVNEALRLKGCSHPYIVKVHELIQEDGLWGMVMEFIEGDDLGIYLDKHGQLSEDKALRYINQVGQALEYVHQQSFLHRDIKPNNIILRDGKEAVLIDFGLAREFSIGKTLSMTNSKTEGYAPVEQYERQGKFGTFTDVYGLAATLYSLLTGEVPFPANFRKQGIPLPSPKQFNPRISNRVNDAIIKGMALEPQNRTQTIREWLDLVNPKSQIEKLKTVRMDYTQLRNLLAAGEWKKGNEETARVMLTLAAREKEGWLNRFSIDNFPLEDLGIIDRLWVKYSNGRFGFSVQKCIYQSLGGTKEYNENIWETFGNRVSWNKEGRWVGTGNTEHWVGVDEGHLPCVQYECDYSSSCYGCLESNSFCEDLRTFVISVDFEEFMMYLLSHPDL